MCKKRQLLALKMPLQKDEFWQQQEINCKNGIVIEQWKGR